MVNLHREPRVIVLEHNTITRINKTSSYFKIAAR